MTMWTRKIKKIKRILYASQTMYNEIMCIIFFNKDFNGMKTKLFVAATRVFIKPTDTSWTGSREGKKDNAEAVDVRDTKTRSDEGIGEGVGQLFMAPIYLLGRSWTR